MGSALTDLVATVSPRLEAMGFLLQRASAYGAEFLCEGTLLCFETEPDYPGLSASIKVADGPIFELGALAETIDPAWYAAYKQHCLEGDPQELDMIVDFLDLHRDQILHHRSTFEGRYRELINARMEALGLAPGLIVR